jgi:Ca2+/H+ antiporter
MIIPFLFVLLDAVGELSSNGSERLGLLTLAVFGTAAAAGAWWGRG